MTVKGFLVALLATAALYGVLHVRNAEWVYEDSTWRNGGAREVGGPSWREYQMPSLFVTFTHLPNRYLTAWSFYLTPDDARVAHAINVCIHLLNAFWLAMLIRRFDGDGWLVGSLFALHPLASQAVAYAAGRSELMATTAVIGVLWFALASRSPAVVRWLGLALCLLSGAMSKPTFVAVIWPLLIWTAWMYRPTAWLEGLEYACGVILALAAVASVAMLYRVQPMPSAVPMWRWFAVQSSASWLLLAAAVMPLHLSIDHAWWTIPTATQIVSALATIVLAGFVLRESVKHNPHPLTFGIGFWWIAIAPRLFVRETQGWMHEHHIYLSLIGFCIAASAAYEWMMAYVWTEPASSTT